MCFWKKSLLWKPVSTTEYKIKKVIATFYLTNLTFLLIIAWYKLAILTLFLKIMSLYLAILRTYQPRTHPPPPPPRSPLKLDFNSQLRVHIS